MCQEPILKERNTKIVEKEHFKYVYNLSTNEVMQRRYIFINNLFMYFFNENFFNIMIIRYSCTYVLPDFIIIILAE